MIKSHLFRQSVWFLFVTLCVAISLYPLLYLLTPGKINLLHSKSDQLLQNIGWRVGFYTHIIGGGLALLIGWSQFVKSWRARYVMAHRWVGKIYICAVLFSSLAAITIAPFSTTGAVAAVGFGSLGVVWLLVTMQALRSIWAKDFRQHERLMIYSYAACCAAVTLRFWLPFLTVVCGLSFSVAYPIVAWSSWVPNLFVAYWIVQRTQRASQHSI